MRRDPWMIRNLLRQFEDGTEIADDPESRYHMALLADGGFLKAPNVLTWKGAELLDLCRDGDRFKAAINQVKAETGGINFDLLTELLSNPELLANPVHD